MALNRAPPIFGRAAITLGIGPHSSLFLSYINDLADSLCIDNLLESNIYLYADDAKLSKLFNIIGN